MEKLGAFDKVFKRKEYGYRTYSECIKILKLLLAIYIPRTQTTMMKRRLTGYIKKVLKLSLKNPSYFLLQGISKKEIAVLKARNPSQFIVTKNEKEVQHKLRNFCGHRFFEAQTIGSKTIDIFLDVYKFGFLDMAEFNRKFCSTNWDDLKKIFERGNRTLCGLAIEVDGPVHDREYKIELDTQKIELATLIGVLLIRVQNNDLHYGGIDKLVSRMKKFKISCSRTRRLIWKKMYLTHVAFLSNDETLLQLFGMNSAQLLNVAGFLEKITVRKTLTDRGL